MLSGNFPALENLIFGAGNPPAVLHVDSSSSSETSEDSDDTEDDYDAFNAAVNPVCSIGCVQ